MLFRDRALAVDAVEHGEAKIEQLVHGRTCAACAGPQPKHRPLRRDNTRGQFVQFGVRRRARRRHRQYEIVEDRGTLDRHALNVDRYFHADRSGRRRQRVYCGTAQHADRLLRRADAIRGLGHRTQHAELIGCVVHRAHLAVDELSRRLSRDVQHRGAGEARLDQSADRVRRTRSGG